MESWRSAFVILREKLNQNKFPLGSMPIIILTADAASAEERRQQSDLLLLSRNAKQVIAIDSGHFIQLERPDLVISAIESIIVKRPNSTN